MGLEWPGWAGAGGWVAGGLVMGGGGDGLGVGGLALRAGPPWGDCAQCCGACLAPDGRHPLREGPSFSSSIPSLSVGRLFFTGVIRDCV